MMSGRLLSKYSFRLSESVLYKSKTRLRLKQFFVADLPLRQDFITKRLYPEGYKQWPQKGISVGQHP